MGFLRLHRRTASAAVRGELGWQKLSARRQILTLQYWYGLETATGANAGRYTVQTYKAEREFLSARLGNTAWNSERYIAGRLRVGQLFTGCVNSLLSNVQLLEKFWCAGTAQSSQQRNEADGHGAKMFSHQLRERVDDCEQARWREELARMSSLKLYTDGSSSS